MIYLNEKNLNQIGIDWKKTTEVIRKAVICLKRQDFSQPVKPYLRYKDLKNRIIAMPAYIGGNFNSAGIKWIASFPSNIKRKLPRAHSVVVLNNALTGEPKAIINTPLLSIIRTVSVSGLVASIFIKNRRLKKFNLGIIGWGPIGKYHFDYFSKEYGANLSKVFIYDNGLNIDRKKIKYNGGGNIIICKTWQEAYCDADIFITCTVSSSRYIDKKPKDGALLLNVSLRDFKASIYNYVKSNIVVDNWEEVCRENTDIELLHKVKSLEEQDVKTIVDIVCNNYLSKTESKDAVMFNPMGMGIFDIAMAEYYRKIAVRDKIGKLLTD